jgi:hypothetical protein
MSRQEELDAFVGTGLITDADILRVLREAEDAFFDSLIHSTSHMPVYWMRVDEGVKLYPPLTNDATIKLPANLPTDQIDEYIRNYKALFGDECEDPRDAAGTEARHHCAYEGHVWVDTGMLRSWCRYCPEDAEWSRAQGKYLPKWQVGRRYDD